MQERPPRHSRAGRALTGIGLAVVLLTLVFTGGTAGYMLVEGWSVWDAFYMTVITVTTVGYREIHPMSRAGEVFTSALLLVGVGTALYTFTLAATIVVEGGWRARMAARRIIRMIDQLDQHFIICGFGRIGRVIAEEFRQQGISFVVVDRNPELVRRVTEAAMLGIEGDASRQEVLERVRIRRARGLVAAVGTDAENVYTILTARELAPDLFIVGRTESEDSERKLLRAGANRVISPYQIGGQQMAQMALRPAVVDFVKLATAAGNLELSMEQVKVGGGSSLAGRSLVEANLRQRFSVIVVGIQRSGGRIEFNPPPDALMQAGDDIVVLGRPSSLRDLEQAASAEARTW